MSSREFSQRNGKDPAKDKQRRSSQDKGKMPSKSRADEVLRQPEPAKKLPEGHPEWLKPTPYDFSGGPTPKDKRLHGEGYGEILSGVAARFEKESAEIRADASADTTTTPDGKRPRSESPRRIPEQWWRCCRCDELHAYDTAGVCYNHREDDYHLRCEECAGTSWRNPETLTPLLKQGKWS
ncbi:hypothetical protein BU16DRAFT_541316 [Lophium mytilinum]|uniref:Uncharacterized protein n=1 Tax=Lophium mytilinum TaxID=390894 RepID=A0A6A6QNE2_9PEZI|nr:hypothetical protein BU16DRAFT_541316 [Lophium mytilinum]